MHRIGDPITLEDGHAGGGGSSDLPHPVGEADLPHDVLVVVGDGGEVLLTGPGCGRLLGVGLAPGTRLDTVFRARRAGAAGLTAVLGDMAARNPVELPVPLLTASGQTVTLVQCGHVEGAVTGIGLVLRPAALTRPTPPVFGRSSPDVTPGLSRDLVRAIRTGAIEIYLQPIARAATHHIAMCEALARWEHPSYGQVPPAVFVPLAERLGLAAELDQLMLARACAHLRALDARAADFPIVSVNAATHEIDSGGWRDRVLAAVRAAGVDPSQLCIELTETSRLSTDRAVLDTLVDVHEAGIRLAIDDLGHGYSAIGHLRNLPIDFVKFDQVFCYDVSPTSDRIVEAICALGDTLGFDVIAEGVETGSQAERLEALGCHHLQGFLFGVPVPAPRFSEMYLRPAACRSAVGV